MSSPCFDKGGSPFVLYCIHGHLFRYHFFEPLFDRQDHGSLDESVVSVLWQTNMVGGGNCTDGTPADATGIITYTK